LLKANPHAEDGGVPVNEPRNLVDRYVAVRNEPDADRRRSVVVELWTEDAIHVLEPPQEVREAGEALDVTPIFQARGHRELEARVSRAYEKFVAPGEYSFRSQGAARRLGDVVKFKWEMVSASGDPAGGGLEFVIVDADGRIRLDYQFIE
jgi:hypothetical protein